MESYNIETSKSIDKFYGFLKRYIVEQKEKLDDINSKLNVYNQIKLFKQNKNISILREMDESLFEKDVRDTIKMISYLTESGITNTSQFDIAINRLLSTPLIENCEENMQKLNDIKELIEKEIRDIEKIISNQDIDIDKFTSLLELSGLDETEKVLALLHTVFLGCPQKVEEYIPKEESVKVEEYISKEEPVKVEENTLYIDKLVEELKIFYEENYRVIADDSETVKSERKANYYWIDFLINGEEDLSKKSLFEKLAILLYRVKDLINKLEKYQLKKQMTIDELSELKTIAECGVKYVSYGNYLVEELKKSILSPDEVSRQKNTVIYLTDDEDDVLFDVKKLKFSEEERKLASNVIKKLENIGPEEDNRVVRGMPKNAHRLYTIKSSNVCCTYMRLSNNIILVVMISNNSNVYDESIQAEKKFHGKISYMVGASYFKPQLLIESEARVIDEVTNIFTSKSK